MGVSSALVKFCGVECYLTNWAESAGAEVVAIVAYIALITYFVIASKKNK